jgi:D-amino-acid dehydrogenase
MCATMSGVCAGMEWSAAPTSGRAGARERRPHREVRYGNAEGLSPFLSGLRVAVVGTGIIGLSVAYHLRKDGADVTVIDRDPEGDKASYGNAGAIAVTEVFPASAPGVLWRIPSWMVDPLGPLSIRPAYVPKLVPWFIRFARSGRAAQIERISRALSVLNSRTYGDLMPMLEGVGLARELNRHGALSVYETDGGFVRDAAEWACKRSRGILVQDVTGVEARELEPSLGSHVRHGVLIPEWSHVNDPKRLMQGLMQWLRRSGVSVERGEVRKIGLDGDAQRVLHFEDRRQITADRVVIAAGVWSGILANALGDRILLQSERGYNMTLVNPGVSVQRQLIFPEHKFVATPLTCGLRIGGAAEFGGLTAPPNFDRSRRLLELARRYLPDLRTEGGTAWAGHRPATPDSLPVIGPSEHHRHVFYACGHGHLGLTQAATTGRLIADLIFRRPPVIDMTPYGIDRF